MGAKNRAVVVGNASRVLLEFEALLDCGDIDQGTTRRGELIRCYDHCRESGGADTPEAMRLLVLAADFCLPLQEWKALDRLLKPYLESGGRAMRTTAIHAAVVKEWIGAAELASAIGDYLFRRRFYREAYAAAAAADEWFEVVSRTFPNEPRVFLGRSWNLARWARISWRTDERRGSADYHLQRCFEGLEAREETIPQSRAHGVEAFACDIAASIDWARGRLLEAEGKSWRGLYLLHRGSVKDTQRRAHCLFTAGKIAASLVSERSFRTADDLLTASERAFKDAEAVIGSPHPLAPLPTIQKVETKIRARTIDEEDARKTLDGLQLKDPVHKAEASVALAWIRGRKGDWQNAELSAREILAEEKVLPTRLRAEGHLQLGRALVERGQFQDGVTELKRAHEISMAGLRVKIVIAVELELANAHLEMGRAEEAEEHWNRATASLGRVRSAYLESRSDEIAAKVGRGWVFVIEAKQGYDLAKKQFGQQFFRRLLRESGGNMSETARQAGVVRSTAIRIVRGLGEDGSPKSAGAGKQPRKRKRRSG